jgi:hypothetical protein
MVVIFLIIKRNKKNHKINNKTNFMIGKEGEKTVADLLDYVTYTNGYKVLNNILLNGGTSESVQIDHIVVGRSGIYLIETKNYKGQIYATNDKEWYQTPHCTANPIPFYSPERQGMYHLYMLAKAIGLKDKSLCHLITAFPNDTNIENHSNANILHFNELAFELCSHRRNLLTNETVEKIYERITKANTYSPQNFKKHIDRVGSLYN